MHDPHYLATVMVPALSAVTASGDRRGDDCVAEGMACRIVVSNGRQPWDTCVDAVLHACHWPSHATAL